MKTTKITFHTDEGFGSMIMTDQHGTSIDVSHIRVRDYVMESDSGNPIFAVEILGRTDPMVLKEILRVFSEIST